MKCHHASKYFCNNYRYLPFLGLLIGMKLCIVTMIIDSRLNQTKVSPSLKLVQQDSWKNLNGKNWPSAQIQNNKMESMKSSKGLDTPVPPDVLRDWKTLANLMNSTIGFSSKNRTDAESIWLIFNRVPESGDEEFVDLLNQLGKLNKFVHQTHEYRTPWKRFLVDQEQENLVRWFEYQHLPKSYDRHFFFVNFTFYQSYIKERPIYVNLVKDPMTRLKSSFQRKRADWQTREEEVKRRDEEVPGSGSIWFRKTFEECVLSSTDPECSYENGTEDFTLSVPFFCGQNFKCVSINNQWALQQAKFTIEKYYSVVGVYENLVESLTVFENYIPRFFKGASHLYKEVLDRRSIDRMGNAKKRRQLEFQDKEVRRVLKKKLPAEFNLYRFITQRLRAQVGFLKKRQTETTPVN